MIKRGPPYGSQACAASDSLCTLDEFGLMAGRRISIMSPAAGWHGCTESLALSCDGEGDEVGHCCMAECCASRYVSLFHNGNRQHDGQLETMSVPTNSTLLATVPFCLTVGSKDTNTGRPGSLLDLPSVRDRFTQECGVHLPWQPGVWPIRAFNAMKPLG